MSFADELRKAEQRMLAQKKQEEKKRKRGGSATKPSQSYWRPEDEIIALYLQKAKASKFLVENYSKKRSLSVRSMNLRMETFAALLKGQEATAISDQTIRIFQEFGDKSEDDLQKTVIGILRGEYNYVSNPKASPTVRR